MLAHFGIANANLVKVEESLQVKLSKLISKPYISSLLLTLGLVGLVIEILTPGFGIGGTISIISFGLFFGGNILAGNSNWTSLALFATGMLLLVVEGIVPGFGLPGIAGIIFVLAGTVLAMGSLASAIASLSIAIIITTVVTVILVKLGFRSKLLDRVILKAEHNKEKGYLSVDSSDIYLDKIGISITELRPSGFIEIDGKKLDVLSDSSFIPKDVQVQVFRVEGSKIFVRRI
jgi:membrane-bound serine protease (ClpP class)